MPCVHCVANRASQFSMLLCLAYLTYSGSSTCFVPSNLCKIQAQTRQHIAAGFETFILGLSNKVVHAVPVIVVPAKEKKLRRLLRLITIVPSKRVDGGMLTASTH